MDPYTQSLLERTRQRREMLNKKLSETPDAAPRKRHIVTEDEPIDIPQVLADDESPKRQCLRQPERNVHPDTPIISSVKSRINTLSQNRAMWSDVDDGDIEHDKPASKDQPMSSKVVGKENIGKMGPNPMKNRLAMLSQTIGSWEDDTSQHNIRKEENLKKPCWKPPISGQDRQVASPQKQPAPQPPKSPVCSRNISSNYVKSPAPPLPTGLNMPPKSPSRMGPKSPAPLPPTGLNMPPKSPTKQVFRPVYEVSNPSDQMPVNARGINESPTEGETTDEEPTKKPVNERMATWAKKITDSPAPSNRPVDPTQTPVSARMANWQHKAGQTPQSEIKQATASRVMNTPKQMCTPAAKITPMQLKIPLQHSATIVLPQTNPDNLDQSFDPAQLPVSVRMASWQSKVEANTKPRESEPTAYSVLARMSAWEDVSSNNQVGSAKKIEPVEGASPKKSPFKQSTIYKSNTPAKSTSSLTPSKSVSDHILHKVTSASNMSPSKASCAMKTVQQRLMEQTQNGSQSCSIAERLRQDRMLELSFLQNRWQNGILRDDTVPPPVPAQPSASSTVQCPIAGATPTKHQEDSIKAKVAADDVTGNSLAKINLKEKRAATNQEKAPTKSTPDNHRPPASPMLSAATNQKHPPPPMLPVLTYQKPPVAPQLPPTVKSLKPTSSPQKSNGGSIYKLIAGGKGGNVTPTASSMPPPKSTPSIITDVNRMSPGKRVQFEPSESESSDCDSLTAAARPTVESDDVGPCESEEEESVQESEMGTTPESDDSDADLSMYAFVPKSVRRQSVLPQPPKDLQTNNDRIVIHRSTTNLQTLAQNDSLTSQESLISLASQTSSESEADPRYRRTTAYESEDIDEMSDETNTGDINDLLDEALDSESDASSTGQAPRPVPRKRRSHMMATGSSDRYRSSQTSELGSPLIYSVSMYRSKRYQEINSRPQPNIVRNSQYTGRDIHEEHIEMPQQSRQEDSRKSIKERLQELQELVNQEQNVIMQTSNALNQCCAPTSAFAGSSEQVECNRLLLISCQKRQSYLTEIQRLKETGRLESYGSGPRGSLTISDIRLPLKKDFVTKIGTPQDNTKHYFLILLWNGSHVIVTQMLSTHDPMMRGSLDFPNLIKLNDITGDFKLTLEIYGNSVITELLTKDKKKKTPKKGLKMNIAAKSPGGPTAVRMTSFALITTLPITMTSLDKGCFSLDRIPYLSPLHGTIYMRLKCMMEANVEERGFLTMFEDVGGLGAWHRRWCVLAKNKICFWKYPDDEHHKDPIGYFDLKRCITEKVGLIPRDICARPHTFELCTVRQPRRGEQDTLITKTYNTMTTTRHMLSADTKEERIVWCNKVNRALANIRTWHSDAMRPMKLSSK